MATTDSSRTAQPPKVKVTEMDHIVLCTRDVDLSLRFYEETLGLQAERLEDFRAGKVPFPSVRLNERTIIDLLPISEQKPVTDSLRNQDHFCMVIEPMDLDMLVAHFQEIGVEVKVGPVTRWGARGNGNSIYIKDPDDNTIELRYYEEGA